MKTARLAAFALLSAAPLTAQSVAALHKGAQVRVIYPPIAGQAARSDEGRLWRLQTDTVTLAQGITLHSIILTPNHQLQILARSHGYGWAGFLLGAVVGGALGGAIHQSCGGAGFLAGGGLCSDNYAMPGVLVGSLFGLLVGAGIRTNEWQAVSTAGLQIN